MASPTCSLNKMQFCCLFFIQFISLSPFPVLMHFHFPYLCHFHSSHHTDFLWGDTLNFLVEKLHVPIVISVWERVKYLLLQPCPFVVV